MKSVRWLYVFLAISIFLESSLFAAAYLARRDKWAPLYGYESPQLAEPDLLEAAVGGDAPSVVVVGTKCARENVALLGRSTWRSVDPPGSFVPLAEVGGRRAKGCQTTRYVNPIPAGVIDLTARLGGRVTWELSGVETPVRDTGAGVTVTWHTEPITVVIRPRDVDSPPTERS